MPGMPGASGKKSKGRAQQQPARGKAKAKAGGRGARSGNPAKRAAQLADAEQRRQLGADPAPSLDLPEEFRDLLPPSR
jgi:signal recognition particle subunit SRP54